jgi:hypothetical protein
MPRMQAALPVCRIQGELQVVENRKGRVMQPDTTDERQRPRWLERPACNGHLIFTPYSATPFVMPRFFAAAMLHRLRVTRPEEMMASSILRG